MAWPPFSGALLLFVLLILLTSIGYRLKKTSGVWKVIVYITLVLLTTRYFLYWRYKTFPTVRWDGSSFSATVGITWVTGAGHPRYEFIPSRLFWALAVLRAAWFRLRQWMGKKRSPAGLRSSGSGRYRSPGLQEGNSSRPAKFQADKDRLHDFWLALLLVAACPGLPESHFDPGHCRHLAIGLMALYFVFATWPTGIHPWL